MSGQNGPDEAARLEAALARIARAFAAQPLHGSSASGAMRTTALAAGDSAASFTNLAGSGRTDVPAAEIAARLDALIAELRNLLGTPPL
jgi:hypothetical protein